MDSLSQQVNCQEFPSQKSLSRSNLEDEAGSDSNSEIEIDIPVKKHKTKQSKQKKPAAEKKKKTKFDWSDDLVDKLINEWQKHTVLFDVSNPEYHLKDKRRNAIQKIMRNFEEHEVFPLPSYEEINKKLSSLRGYFVAEKNKNNQSRVSGAGADDVYRSRWQFFDSLSFLADNIAPRRTESNLNKQCSEETAVDEENNQYAYSAVNKPSAKLSKKTEAKRTNDLIETAIDTLKKPRREQGERTADQIFGEMVWKMLHEIPESYAKDMAKMDIQRQLIQLKHARPTQPTMMYPQNQQPQNYANPFNFRGTPSPALDSHTNSRAHQSYSLESEQERCSEQSFTILD